MRAKRREEDEVFVMEARLKLLKEQMATERKKREDALSKNGSGSVWLAGRAGPLRGVRDVRGIRDARWNRLEFDVELRDAVLH